MSVLSWILVLAATTAAVVTGLLIPGDPPIEIARILFGLFLVALIAAGLRAVTRSRHHL